MSTDHELLKRAAKAAGITLIRWNETYACYETSGGLWNPYLNDGDALRLAVAIKDRMPSRAFILHIGSCASVTNAEKNRQEYHNGDPYAATRLAILRAAAEIEPQ